MSSANIILNVVASPRGEASVSRQLAGKVIDRLSDGSTQIITRDVSDGVPVVDGAWIGAAHGGDDKTPLTTSEELVAEVKAADHIVIATPIWNFGVPAALKAWVDQIARAGVTFKYSEAGPVGLLEGKRATIVISSGGTEAGSEIDFATPYLKHVLGFIGVHDVDLVAADRLMVDADASMAKADAAINALAA
ncbi:NAD(P)H-dependent oxidoreductase [Ahrensia marina]|uniref:FMN-dependent NADH-azoreductase n=1 Tax=Ahrensia marina TaxID=1514904 RepID=UPI0035D1360D